MEFLNRRSTLVVLFPCRASQVGCTLYHKEDSGSENCEQRKVEQICAYEGTSMSSTVYSP